MSGRVVARWALLWLVAVVLTGCWRTPSLEKRGVVPLLAIDSNGTGGYRVTVAIIQPPGLSPPGPTGSGSQGNTPVFLRSAAAPSVAAAVHAITSRTYLYMDFTHLEAVVVSAAVARQGLAPVLAYLARSLEFSQTGWLLVARHGSAAQLLEAIQKDLPRPNDVLTATVHATRVHSPFRAARVMTALKEIPLAGTSLVTAGVATGPTVSGTQTVPLVMSGDALFRGDRMVGWLTGSAALGWALYTQHLNYQQVSVPVGTHHIQLAVMGERRHLRILGEGSGPPRITVDLSVDAHLDSTPGGSNLWRSPGQLRPMARAADQSLARAVDAAFARAQAVGSDPFGLGEDLRVFDPAYWDRVRARWADGAFRSLALTVRVDVHISSVGEILCPLVHAC